MIFHQLFEKESSTYTYLLGDSISGEAVIIDPVIETIDRDLKLITELGLKLKYILDTHVHADHVTASGELRQKTGAQIGLSSACKVGCADLALKDNQELKFGNHTIKAIHTPGHTSGCITYQVGTFLFTGDTVLIRGCGRTDFQDGSAATLYESVREKIFTLPKDYTIYPAHDYKGFTSTRIGDEMKLNPRLKMSVSKEEFIQIMDNLHLDYPKKIQQAVPANLACGILNAH